MARSTISSHEKRAEIEFGLARNVPLRVIAKRYGVHIQALKRHRQKLREDTPAAFRALALENWAVASEDDLARLRDETGRGVLILARSISQRVDGALNQAIEVGDWHHVATLAAQAQKALHTLCRLSGELNDASSVVVNNFNNFAVSPAYLRLKYALASAVRDHPGARDAILTALRDVEGTPMDLSPRRLPNGGQFKTIEHDQPVS